MHNSEDKSALLKAYENRKDNKEYINSSEEAKTRAEVDWLLGINSTIYASTKAYLTAKLGRVKVPIMEYINDRDLEIENFVSTEYFKVENEKTLKLTSKTEFKTEEEAKKHCDFLNKFKANVRKITKEDLIRKAPSFFTQTSLQTYMSKKYKWSMSKTMQIAQNIYNKRYITYPRADSSCFSNSEKESVREVVEFLLNENITDKIKFKDNKDIFNDKKVKSHTALRPTTELPKELFPDEKLLYEVILNRFLANFCSEDRIVNKTTYIIEVADEIFNVSGETLVQEGWGVFEKQTITNNLPVLKEREEFPVEFTPISKWTTPPAKINITTLNNWLDNPFKKDDFTEDDELEINLSDLKIGTIATRPNIIKQLLEEEYLTTDKNDNFSITELGRKILEIKNELEININKNTTAEIENLLAKVGRGEFQRQVVKQIIVNLIKEFIAKNKSVSNISGKKRIPLGKCPKCGGNVYRSKFNYQCENVYPNNSCDFKININQRGTELTDNDIKELLFNKQTTLTVKNKEGVGYTAIFEIEEVKDKKDMNKTYYNLKFVKFPEK